MKKAVETPRKKDSTKETVLRLSERKWKMAFSDESWKRHVTTDDRDLEQLQEGICKAKRMKQAGKSMKNITEALGLSLEYIHKILNMNLRCVKSRCCQAI
jgi:hypothetical protein